MFAFCSGEGGQGVAASRGAESQAEQPAVTGRVPEHCGTSHQSHRATLQCQQAVLAEKSNPWRQDLHSSKHQKTNANVMPANKAPT